MKLLSALTLSLFSLCFTNSYFCNAQDSLYAGALNDSNYFKNPAVYLSHLDSNKINHEILIDRVPYEQEIINTNGTNRVLTTEYQDFYHIYQSLKYAHQDTSLLIPFDSLITISSAVYQKENVNLISVIDMNFRRISPTAVAKGEFVQANDYLQDDYATENSYSNERTVSFSCFKHNVFGDEVKFLLHEAFILSNQLDKELQAVEIDFDNGAGFIPVSLNETITISYVTESRYHELKIKLKYLNLNTGEEETVYAHSSIYRKAKMGHLASNFYNSKNPELELLGSVKSYVDDPDKKFTFPHAPEIKTIYIFGRPFQFQVAAPYALDVYILFSPHNSSGMLRRPFIMVDGFDPDNKRDYWTTTKDKPWHELLPMERDYRGLYEHLNGGLSPWDSESETVPFLGDKLREEGYDLIFVNFQQGAGNILSNAAQLRKLLNEQINGALRDNKTEEAILVGPSMGGLITRIALKEMENAREEHYVKTWLSFDSPHKGASIPIALQHASEFGAKFNTVGNKNPFVAALDKVNETAAKQLLLHHHTQTSSNRAKPAPEHTSLQSYLNSIGFPVISKNYAITNGGKNTLYSGRQKIINFKRFFWTHLEGYNNIEQDLPIAIFVGSRQGFSNDKYIILKNDMSIENGPGGWIGALYSLNYSEDNKEEWPFTSTYRHGQKSNFIPTPSAFGIPVTGETVHSTWESYTDCNDLSSGKTRTPFDGIFGMIENEEHMKISSRTKEHVLDQWFIPDFKNAHHPVLRTGDPIHQSASKAGAYIAQESITFAGSNNSFSIKKTADVNMAAGQNILFLPGFKIEKGAKLHAKITPTSSKKYLLRQKTSEGFVDNRNYLSSSPFTHRSYDYSSKQHSNGKQAHETTSLELQVHPNPATENLNILLKGGKRKEMMVLEVVQTGGQVVFKEQVQSNYNYQLKLNSWAPGVYIVRLTSANQNIHSKFVKL